MRLLAALGKEFVMACRKAYDFATGLLARRLPHRAFERLRARRYRVLLTLAGLACVIAVCWGCSAVSRKVAKQDPAPEAKSASIASAGAAKGKTVDGAQAPKPAPVLGQEGTSKKIALKPGQTELEAVREIAIDLTKEHAPVEQMRLCYAKRAREWWITLFRDEGHAFDLKQYIWTPAEEKLDPFCVEKVIPREAIDDYLFESRPDRECTALEHSKKGWIAIKSRSDEKKPAKSVTHPKRPERRSSRTPEPWIPEVRLVSGTDAELALNLTNVSTGPSRVSDYVFVYGSEMRHTDLLRWLRGRGYNPEFLLDASAAKLNGYDFVWNYYSNVKGGGTANIRPTKDSVVWGLLLEVDSRLLEALDRKQGSPTTYSRGAKRIPVRRVEDGRTVLAWVYTAKPNRDGRTDVWPTNRYKKDIAQAASFWGFPQRYVEKIRQWHTNR